MEQIEMPLEMRQSQAFSSADIKEVKVHALSRQWDFHFSFDQILPIGLYQELAYRLVSTFKEADIKATFTIEAGSVDFSDADLLQAYYAES
ncbi:PolC-type DNA polymerase III N-terminal domain-containing protein, partial [Larkinella sp. C7]|uniref:PolC-type DNA polymerase III N-terminal domain-containing protein n=1 Tax=Larkinella sp. C7 TaxID=2576607 RepID=UPI0011112B79